MVIILLLTLVILRYIVLLNNLYFLIIGDIMNNNKIYSIVGILTFILIFTMSSSFAVSNEKSEEVKNYQVNTFDKKFQRLK